MEAFRVAALDEGAVMPVEHPERRKKLGNTQVGLRFIRAGVVQLGSKTADGPHLLLKETTDVHQE